MNKTRVLPFTLLFVSTLCLNTPAGAVGQSGECPLPHSHMGEGSEHIQGMEMEHMHMQGVKGLALAESECSSCHGEHGISTADDIPNLAGQNPIYLCEWLAGCRQEGKKCESHEDIAAKLTDQNIIDLSEFYGHMHDYPW